MVDVVVCVWVDRIVWGDLDLLDALPVYGLASGVWWVLKMHCSFLRLGGLGLLDVCNHVAHGRTVRIPAHPSTSLVGFRQRLHCSLTLCYCNTVLIYCTGSTDRKCDHFFPGRCSFHLQQSDFCQYRFCDLQSWAQAAVLELTQLSSWNGGMNVWFEIIMVMAVRGCPKAFQLSYSHQIGGHLRC